jgi:hypothetical protein
VLRAQEPQRGSHPPDNILADSTLTLR